jgi:hypothetical protein
MSYIVTINRKTGQEVSRKLRSRGRPPKGLVQVGNDYVIYINNNEVVQDSPKDIIQAVEKKITPEVIVEEIIVENNSINDNSVEDNSVEDNNEEDHVEVTEVKVKKRDSVIKDISDLSDRLTFNEIIDGLSLSTVRIDRNSDNSCVSFIEPLLSSLLENRGYPALPYDSILPKVVIDSGDNTIKIRKRHTKGISIESDNFPDIILKNAMKLN